MQRFIFMRDDDRAMKDELVVEKLRDHQDVVVLDAETGWLFVRAEEATVEDLAIEIPGWTITKEIRYRLPEPVVPPSFRGAKSG